MSINHTCLHQHWYEHSRIIFQHTGLSLCEKFLWLWLAIHNNQAENTKQDCLYSYRQLSQAMNQPCESIHRSLFTLKIMGCLRGALPVTYQKLDEATTHEERKLIPCVPSQLFRDYKEALKEQLQGELFNKDRGFISQEIRRCLGRINYEIMTNDRYQVTF